MSMSPEQRAQNAIRMQQGRAAARARRQEQGPALPRAEVLGTLKPHIASPPMVEGSTWVSPSGEVIQLTEAPPWAQHVVGKGRDATDARQFVKVPDGWVLRWRSPKSLNDHGQLGWMPVTKGTPGVTPLVASMVAPDNTIRRGYQGDILHFMPRTWWEARMAEKQQIVRARSASARDKQDQFMDDANRGKFGRHIRGGWDPSDRGKTPVATQFVASSGEHPV